MIRARLPVRLALIVPVVLALAVVSAGPPAAAAPSLGDVSKRISALTAQLNRANEQYDTAGVRLGQVRTQQAKVRRQLAAGASRVARLRDQAASYAASAYKGGDLSMMGSVMGGGSADTFLDQLTTLDALTHQAELPLQQLQAARAALAAQNGRLQGLATAAAGLLNTLAATRAAFNAQLKPLMVLQAQLSPAYADNTTSATAPPGSPASVRFAYAQLGDPYVFGAAGPADWDCSGLTMMAYRRIGVSLEHSAHLQYEALAHVSRSDIRPGDLVFFYDLEHVGIAVSRTQVIHAPEPGEPVKISNISDMPYYGAARAS